ncbi:MAG: hypothetical protein JWQ43_1518 [Glaciihabitans sp.]|nr:hypothetical protein [Glaciihabitans sp.]
MPAEPNLFDLFRNSNDDTAPKLDAQEIIRRSRRRRLPRRIGAGALGTLAVTGIGVVGVSGISSLGQGVSTASDSAASAPESSRFDGAESGDGTIKADGTVKSDGNPEFQGTAVSRDDAGSSDEQGNDFQNYSADGDLTQDSSSELYDSATPTGATGMSVGHAPAEKLNLCGGTLVEVAPAESGLQLTVQFLDGAAAASTITGTATLTNTGTESVTGYTAATPAITLSRDNVVLWHSNGPMIMMIVDVNLAPGESMSYPASFSPVSCDVEDDLAESFREDLPHVAAGDYQLGAAIDLNLDSSSELVTGPLATVTLK